MLRNTVSFEVSSSFFTAKTARLSMPSRPRSSRSTLRISVNNLNSEGNEAILVRKDSAEEMQGTTLAKTESEQSRALRNKINSAIQNFDFGNAARLSFELVRLYPNVAEYLILHAKSLFLNQKYRSALFWLQESQVFSSLYSQETTLTGTVPLLKPLSPWGSNNTENQFNLFNLPRSQDETSEKDKNSFKLFEEMEDDRCIVFRKRLEVAYLAVKCLIGCNEKNQALDLIDHFVHDDSVDEIYKNAKFNKSEDIISRFCHTRSTLLLEEVRIEEAIFYLKASLKCDPLNLEAKELIQNYQLAPEEKRSLNKEQVFELPPIFGNIEPLALNFSIAEIRPIRKLLFLGKYTDALKRSNALLKSNPHLLDYQALYVQCLLESESITELFSFSHDCLKYEPDSCISNYAIGCYYYLKNNYSEAGKNLLRATKKNKFFAPAWFMFGKCFSKDGISNKAFAVYEFASTLFSGSYLFPLATALEYIGQNNSTLVTHYLFRALQLNDEEDPVVEAHLGCVYFKQGKLIEAEQCLRHTFEFLQGFIEDTEVLKKWRGTLMNYGHCLATYKKYDEAINIFLLCLTAEAEAEVFLALGVCHHSIFKTKQILDLRHKGITVNESQMFNISKSVDFLEQAVRCSDALGDDIKISEALERALNDFLACKRDVAIHKQDVMENIQEGFDDDIDATLLTKTQNGVQDSEETSENEQAEETFFQPASKLYSKLSFEATEENAQSCIRSLTDDEKDSTTSFRTTQGYETPTMTSDFPETGRVVSRLTLDSSEGDTQESSYMDFTPRTDDVSLLSGRRRQRNVTSD